LRQMFRDSRFALTELILILLCGIVWLINSQWGMWLVVIAISSFLLRVLSRQLRFVSLDWLILVFFITTWIGYWAAYDQAVASMANHDRDSVIFLPARAA